MNRSAKAAKAPKVSKPEKWRGVDLQKVDATILAETCERLKLKPAPDSGVKGLVDCYCDHVATLLQGDEEPFVCDVCGAPSTDGDAACEACGSEGGVVDGQAPAAEKPEPVTRIAPVKAPKPPKVEKASEPTTESAPTKRRVVDAAEPVEAQGIVVGTVKDLDESVERIRGLTHSSLNSYYELGRQLLDCYERGLYKLRVVDGRPVHSTWAAFVHAECGIARAQAGNLMALAVEFTPEKFAEIGPSKLLVVLRAPAEYREELLAKAASGSYRELAKDLARLAPGKVGRPPLAVGGGASKRRDGNRTGGRFTGDSTPEPRETSRVPKGSVSTIVTFGIVELDLKPYGKKAMQATEQLSDGCIITYTVTGKTLRIERKPSV